MGFLHNDALCFVGHELLTSNPLFPLERFDIFFFFWMDAHQVSMRSDFSLKSLCGYIRTVLLCLVMLVRRSGRVDSTTIIAVL